MDNHKAAQALAQQIAELIEPHHPAVAMTALTITTGCPVAMLLPPCEVSRALALQAEGTRDIAHDAMLKAARPEGALPC